MEVLHPSRGWILIKVLDGEKKTGGVYLPEDMEDQPMYGEVIEVGKPLIKEGGVVLEIDGEIPQPEGGTKKRKLQPKDVIIYKQHTQHEIPSYVGDTVAFVNFESVLGVKFPEEQKKEDKK